MPRPTPPGSALTIEDEVLANIRAQSLGGYPNAATVGDYDLPETLLRRLADRIIRETFIERHRQVLSNSPPEPPPPQEPDDVPAERMPVRVHRRELPPDVAAYRAALPEARPELPGYRAPLLGDAGDLWPWSFPDQSDPALAAAAGHVARRLPKDGLLPTLAAAIQLLGLHRVRSEGLPLLRRAGLPVDLLGHFSLETAEDGADLVAALAGLLESAGPGAAARAAAAARFFYRPTLGGFRLHPAAVGVSLVRVHLTGASYWGGRGAGGALDVARQLVTELSGSSVIAVAHERDVPALLARVAEWDVADRLTLLPVPFVVSQWAQDNAKMGVIDGGTGPAVLLPRFAGRGEDGSIHIPGDTFAGEALAAAGLLAAQSPLLFQGGNLLASRTADGALTLLVGEAEVARNTVLGLSSRQALDALRTEFGADRALVLPAVSFHIDFDILPWETPDGPIAFVNEPLRAAHEIIRITLAPLRGAGVVSNADARSIADHLDAGRLGPAAAIVSAKLAASTGGAFPISLAEHFSTGPQDDGPSNLRRLLIALDLVFAETPGSAAAPGHAGAYLRSFRRSAADRRELRRWLVSGGFRVFTVPGISEAVHGISYLNGLRDGHRLLMPAYAGLYSPLDDLAAGEFLRRLPAGSEVIRVRSAETQRRCGGLHCAAAVFG